MTPAPTSSPAQPASPAARPIVGSGVGRRVRVVASAAAVVALAVHLWGLYRDHGPPTPGWFPQADKLEHLVGFGLPCLLVLVALHLHAAGAGRPLSARAVALVVGLFALHAGVSEVVQGDFYTSRSGDPFDALADVVGTALGLAAYRVLRRRVAHGRG